MKKEKCEEGRRAPALTPECLRSYCFFSSLSDQALETLVDKMHLVEFPAGSDIVREGAMGDAFYMIHSGKVEVKKNTAHDISAVLSTMDKGEVFGEMSLLTSSPRSATVSALTDVTLLKLLKEDFSNAVLSDAAFSSKLKDRSAGYSNFEKIKVLEPFALLEPDQVTLMMDRLEERTYGAGENIVTQGEDGDEYFIIKSGCVGVLKQMLEDKPEVVAIMNDGEAFGEEAILTGAKRSATVKAIDETVTWVLSRNDFEEILKTKFLEEITFDSLPSGKSNGSVILDVRTTMEFDEEYIPEALNLPLDELRQKYSELDKDRDYYTYCLMGARSAIAAFLLNMHGFKAKSLKGGIMDWTGPLVEGAGSGIHQPHGST